MEVHVGFAKHAEDVDHPGVVVVVPVCHAKHAEVIDRLDVIVPVGFAKHAEEVDHPGVVIPAGPAKPVEDVDCPDVVKLGHAKHVKLLTNLIWLYPLVMLKILSISCYCGVLLHK